MSRGRTRARRRATCRAQLRDELQYARENPALLEGTLRRIAASGVRLWAVAQAAGQDKPLDDDERAAVADAAAPDLAW